MKTPITREKLQHHITYSSWKYILLVLVAIFGWNIVYTMTQYQPPEEKKIVMGIYSYGGTDYLNPYLEKTRLEYLPDMEELTGLFLMPDQSHGAMILTAHITARDCDIYILPRNEFQNYAAQGAFMPLEEMLPDLIADLEAAGISLSRGYRTYEETGEKHQYGIPCADLPGIMRMLQCDTRDMYIGVFFDTGNDENVLKFTEQFVRDMLIEPEPLEPLAE